MQKQTSVLAIDRGSKYIGLAHMNKQDKMIFPVWYILNDSMTYFSIADLIQRYTVKTIVLGWPAKQKDIQAKIEKFMEWLGYIVETKDIEIEKVEEDYTSVQAGEVVSNFKKNATSDTISAMVILERWKIEKELKK